MAAYSSTPDTWPNAISSVTAKAAGVEVDIGVMVKFFVDHPEVECPFDILYERRDDQHPPTVGVELHLANKDELEPEYRLISTRCSNACSYEEFQDLVGIQVGMRKISELRHFASRCHVFPRLADAHWVFLATMMTTYLKDCPSDTDDEDEEEEKENQQNRQPSSPAEEDEEDGEMVDPAHIDEEEDTEVWQVDPKYALMYYKLQKLTTPPKQFESQFFYDTWAFCQEKMCKYCEQVPCQWRVNSCKKCFSVLCAGCLTSVSGGIGREYGMTLNVREACPICEFTPNSEALIKGDCCPGPCKKI